MLRSLRTLRSFPRIKDIAWILGKHGFYQVAEALQAPVLTRIRQVFKREPRHTIQQPERLRMVLEELGPTFIKFGQLLSTRPDVVPHEYILELSRLQDEVHPEPFEEIRSLLDEQFDGQLDRHFRSFEPVALASASIAQVHRATTLDGQEVVVKVRKRGLENLVAQDLRVLTLFAEFLSGWRDLRLFDPEGVVRFFERSIQRELNFDYERFNQQRIRESLGARSRVYVPRVFEELSREGVLTMEYLAGEKLSHARQSPLDPDIGHELGVHIAVAILKQIFEHGFYHADPHPGNFIVMRDGRVGLIDFGNVGKCTPDMLDDLLLLIVGLIRRNYKAIARWLLKRGHPPKDLDVDSLAMELMDVLDPYYGVGLGDIKIGSLFRSLFSMVVRRGLEIPAQYVHVARNFMTLEGTVRLCSPDLEVLPAIRPFMTQVMRRRWAPERLVREWKDDATQFFAALKSYPTNLAEVLSRAAEGRLRVESSIPEVHQVERRLDQISHRVPLAVVTSGLLVSASILLYAHTADAGVGRFSFVLGVIGFLVGLLMACRLLLTR